MELIIRIVILLKAVIYQILRPYFWYINREPGKKVPPIKNKILKLSAVAIAEKIRRRELSSEAVVSAYIDRIKEVNPLLNAVVEDRFEAAIEDAKACDKKLAAGSISAKELETEKPLFGVPLTVKESCALKGLSHTGCTIARAGVKANYDSTTVQILKNAGAIPLCVTNTPELCLAFEATNMLFGTTNNPYDIRRTAGGSSGGEGALLGSGASIIGIGSDIAGSVRVPGLFNGIFAHKPTSGIVSIEGHFPMTEDPDFKRFLVIGPMARYAEDLEFTLKIMAHRYCTHLRLDEPVDVRSLKVRYIEEIGKSFGLISPNEDIKRAVRRAAGYLESVTADVQKVDIKELKNSLELSLSLLIGMKELPQMLMNPDDPKHESNSVHEFLKSLFGLSRYTKSAILIKMLRNINAGIPRSKFPYYRSEVQRLQRIFADLLGTDGVLLIPTFTGPAPYHNQVILNLQGFMYCLLFNVLGFPSTQVPMGFDKDGLPIGLQVISLPMQDRLCLAVAKELEKGFGGWIAPEARS